MGLLHITCGKDRLMINKYEGSHHLVFWVEIDPIAPNGGTIQLKFQRYPVKPE